jgi:hypothetical protein
VLARRSLFDGLRADLRTTHTERNGVRRELAGGTAHRFGVDQCGVPVGGDDAEVVDGGGVAETGASMAPRVPLLRIPVNPYTQSGVFRTRVSEAA